MAGTEDPKPGPLRQHRQIALPTFGLQADDRRAGPQICPVGEARVFKPINAVARVRVCGRAGRLKPPHATSLARAITLTTQVRHLWTCDQVDIFPGLL